MTSPAATSDAIDRGAVTRRVAELNRMLAMHAGGIALESIDDDGCVSVRFTGMCAGCQSRPVTLMTTVEPGLQEIPGVNAVHTIGSRVSSEAAERLRRALLATDRPGLMPAWRPDPGDAQPR